jgi:primosomal protein N' (replication factor Y) (superfamily II helicase)
MYIIEVIPLQHLPKNVSQILSYYHKQPIQKGTIVEIQVKTKKILALVANSTPISNLKNELKSNAFTLKKISKIVTEKPIVDKTFWNISKFISTYYFDDLTRVVKILLPSNLKSLIKYLNKKTTNQDIDKLEINKKKEYIFNKNIYQNITTTFNNNKSILLTFPTESHLSFYLNHFKQIFNENNFVILNKKPSTKNKNIWYSQLLQNQPKLIFGLRKTLGFPLDNINLIYVFDSNNESYKSWDLRPYFNYETVISFIANQKKIPIYFQKNDLYISKSKNIKQDIKTFNTITPKTNPNTQIIINRDFNKKDLLGYSIKQDIFKLINNKQKWIIFLNKKGFWNGVECKKCKTILYCDKCNKPLTYFRTKKENYLKCSLCNKKYPVIMTCPKCKSHEFQPTTLGIDKLEQNILQLLKQKDIKIFNIQSEEKEEIIQENITNFLNNKNGILIGTSIVLRPQIKNIENIAILNIDNLFYIPNYNTEEKILNTILKLKSIATKNIYIKTTLKNNKIFDIIKNDSYHDFWKNELSLRKKYNFPPFSQITHIEYKDIDQTKSKQEIEKYYLKIKKTIEKNNLENKFIITSISPNYHEKIKNKYYWSFNIKMKLEDPNILTSNDIKMRNQLLKLLPSDFYIDVDPIN